MGDYSRFGSGDFGLGGASEADEFVRNSLGLGLGGAGAPSFPTKKIFEKLIAKQ
jgi:hypothetical protein